MARPRSDTATLIREGHSISLKVLRLSKPSLTQQSTISKSNTANIPQEVSLAYPSKAIDGDFILTPILSLPPSFGSAYIGETFSCAIVANNELTSQTATKSVSNLHLTVEMQTPSQTYPLRLITSPNSIEIPEDEPIKQGTSIQHIVEFPLREEGNHTLAVSVHYTESTPTDLSSPTSPSSPTSSRTRTFRKMYQFPTTPCLSVRTKATELPALEISEKQLGDPYARTVLLRYALEAQLENVSEMRISLEKATLLARPPFGMTPLNGGLVSEDADDTASANAEQIVLQPRSVHQLLFLVEQMNVSEGLDELKAGLKTEGRAVLGQIALEWRSSMGEKGSLSTGSLMTRRRQ